MGNTGPWLREAQQRVQAYLDDNPDATVAELMRHCDFTEYGVRRYLQHLHHSEPSGELGPLAAMDATDFWKRVAATSKLRIKSGKESNRDKTAQRTRRKT